METITIIGSGQIAMAVAGSLALCNERLAKKEITTKLDLEGILEFWF